MFIEIYVCNSRFIGMQAYFMKGFLRLLWSVKIALFLAEVQLVA